jgi:hypothetical protein
MIYFYFYLASFLFIFIYFLCADDDDKCLAVKINKKRGQKIYFFIFIFYFYDVQVLGDFSYIVQKRVIFKIQMTLPPYKAHQNPGPFIYQNIRPLKNNMIKQIKLYT